MNEALGTRYRLVRQIGAGGMAQVVEAVATGAAGFERRVAIKWVLPEKAEDDSMRRMFLDEARIASHLHHGSIVQVLDYGMMDGSEFIVCEFVDGMDMNRARRRAGGTVPETVALHVVSEIGHALDHAHNRNDAAGRPLGIVHRDVSPANILVSWDGDVKLSDFGIAYALTREEKTQTGYVKGKARYMAPEQALGAEISGAADVFALGVVLQVLLTGGSSRMYGHVTKEPQEYDFSEDISGLVNQCLAEDPEERPSARAVAEVAERLRQRRTEDTGRRELRDWLAPLNTRAAPRRIDRFAGQVVVEEAPGSRVYTLSTAEEAGQGDAATVGAVEGEADTDTVQLPVRRNGPAAALLIASALATGVVGWWALTNGASPTTEQLAEAPRDAGAAQQEEPAPDTSPPAPPMEPEAQMETTAPATMAPPPEPETPARSGMRRVEARSEEPSPERPTMEEAAPTDAWFKVVGHLGQQVYLDGRPVGWAPGDFRASTGAHRVEIRGAEGEPIGARGIELGSQHASKQRAFVVRIPASE